MKKPLLSILLIAVLAGLAACMHRPRESGVRVETPYSAVLLDNNSVYYGKLEHENSEFLELTDVYYVQQSVNQETKEVKNILVRRGNEWHGPDRMFLNARHVVLVEPVGTSSKVAQLIQEDKNKK